MTIRRLPSGRWRARFTDHNGRQKAAPRTFTTKAEAGRWLSRTQSEMDRGQFVDPKVGKWKDAAPFKFCVDGAVDGIIKGGILSADVTRASR